MKSFPYRSLTLIAILAVGLFLSGCGKQKVNITGQVLRDGKPIELSKTGVVFVTLVSIVEPGKPFTTHPGKAKADGSFEILDITPGKYRIAVEVQDPTPMEDRLEGAFSRKNSPIIKDLDGKTPLTVDLARPTE
jgi:hypothetical protein